MPRGALVTPEALAAGVLGAAAAIMVTGVLLDAVHCAISPLGSTVLALVCGAALCRITPRAFSDSEDGNEGATIVLFGLVALSVAASLLWLAWPSLLPVVDGPDIVHHLSLIHVLQRTHRLPHDPALAPYLGEMMQYTPGSHLLGATLASLLQVDAIRVVHPVMAAAAGMKAALVFLVARRVVPSDAGSPWPALAAPVLLLMPAEYFYRSITGFGFYAQVVSEMFAAGMLLAIVGWRETHASGWLIVFAVAGIGAFLAWPVWVPVAMTSLAIVIARDRAMGEGARDLLVAFAPVIAIGVLHVATHRGGASILGSGGVVTVPTLAVFGAGFLVLACAGVLAGARDTRARPLVVFLAVAVLQAAALAALNRWTGSSSLYLPYKMVYLIMLPCAVLAAYSLARLCALAQPRSRGLRRVLPYLPIAIAVALAWGRVPASRLRSPINESAYAAGLWARDRLPAGCIDYFSRHWLTGYWLHLDVLGNPRASRRMDAETFEFKDAVAKWIEGRGMPYGIVEDVAMLPNDMRADIDVLAHFGAAAVIRRRGLTPSVCRE